MFNFGVNWNVGPSSALVVPAIVISVPAVAIAQDIPRPNVPIRSEQGLFQDLVDREEKKIVTRNSIPLEDMCRLVVLNVHQKDIKEAEEFYRKAENMGGNRPLLAITEARLVYGRFRHEWDTKKIGRDTARRQLDDVIEKMQEVFVDKSNNKEIRREAHYMMGLFNLRLSEVVKNHRNDRLAFNNLVRAAEMGHPLAYAELISGKIGLVISYGMQKSKIKRGSLSKERKREKIEQLDKRIRSVVQTEVPELYKRGVECALALDDNTEKLWAHIVLNFRFAFFCSQMGDLAKTEHSTNVLYTHARLMIEDTLKIDPNNERGHNYYGVVYMRFAILNNDYEKKMFFINRSINGFRKALEINPHDSGLYCNLIRALKYKADHTERSKCAEEAAPIYQNMMAFCRKLAGMNETHNVPERDLGYAKKVLDWGKEKGLDKKEDASQEKR
jgi:tetratricopeptide (TPR) repeat protein